ncbi:hypothetical protein MSAN_01207600 [Mycena sanguinolenta]|uniref:F-box domain-containing protein n=1 Tax=Mycena sanguinolenta TaxID=230812 RepID=A0A8H6YI27_9AGAR|nr:hypothetical protein MSAN_01207600 [Mycena sanguinolenta]
MNFQEQVPEELWLEIIRHLPKEALPAVALTHRAFHRILRPMLFTNFTFRPYAVAYLPRDRRRVLWPEATEPIQFPQHTYDHELARLNFWSSTEIAPLVRSCTLIPSYSPSTDRVTNTGTNVPTPLLTLFFERLARFISIRYFHGFFVRITQTGLANLCRLPVLTCSDIFVCSALEPLDFSALQLQHVTNLYIAGAVKSNNSLDWMCILRPTQLIEVHLAFSPQLFTEIAHSMPTWPQVKKLTIGRILLGDTLRPPGIPTVLPVLAKFPGVEKFALEGRWNTWDWVPSTSHSLPCLQDYTGPAKVLGIFRAHTGLARASIHGVSSSWITETVQESKTRPLSISSLRITSSPLDIPAFNALFDIFPLMVHLDINIFHSLDILSECPRFLENLTVTPSLPITLESLSFRWERNDANLATENDGLVADELSFRTGLRALVERYPALKSFCIDCPVFSFRLRRLPNGTVDAYW